MGIISNFPQGGKIDIIKVNNVEQPVVNSSVNIAVPTQASDVGADPAGSAASVQSNLNAVTAKISDSASATNKLVSASEMGDAIEAVEAKQLYKTASQGSFATKAELTGATTFYNADGTVATPTKNDVAYVLADESHSGKAAKYVIASTNPIVWGFVITFSDVTFTQTQMNAINSGATSEKITGYDSHIGDNGIHVTSNDKTNWNNKGTYSKPSTGIPKTDLASDVQTSLGKADTALQSVPSTYRTAAAQDTIDAGKVSTADYAPVTKTDAMTQAVGKDNAGKLWTTPGSSIELQSIEITHAPTKTSYYVGDVFDNSGMVITARYRYALSEVVTGYTVSPSGALSASDTSVTITYSEGGITKTVTQPITVQKYTVTIPSQNGSLTYNGSEQSVIWNNYDTSKMSVSGATSGTNADSYSATFTLKDTNRYKWANDSTAAQTVTWSIGKAAGSLSLSRSSVTLNSSAKSATVNVTRAGDGAISAVSNDTSVATVSVNGTTLTINSVNDTSGTATVTVSVAASTNYTAPSSKTVTVSAEFLPVKKALNDTSWADISTVSAAGQAANYWAVGDRKAVAINGTVGQQSISGTYYVYIIGINHNSSKEGNGIQFGTFKTALSGGTDVCLIDSYYGSYQSYSGTKYFQMNHWGNSSNYNTNYGGWAACDMRYDILGSTNVAPSPYGSTKTTSATGSNPSATCATNPVANTLMAALPAELRAVMKPITKYTDNKGNSSNAAANVTATIDYLPLLSEFEVQGARSYANEYEQNSQAQYAYYSAGNSKVKYRHSSTGSTARWWVRSPSYNNAYRFCLVNTDGSAYYINASLSTGLAPAFMV